LFVAVVTICGFMIITFASLPKSEKFYVTGTLVSKQSKRLQRSSGDVLNVRLESGKEVIAIYPVETGLRSGDKVKLMGYKRFIFGNRYHYDSKVTQLSRG